MVSSITHVDVLVIGAGLSGIAAGYHLQAESPLSSYLILESRAVIGGTWDLFRYPGIRSDSDMYTLGYSFRPWSGARAIADGPSILEYIRETAKAFGIDEKIRFHHRADKASWSSDEARWTVEVTQIETGEAAQFKCRFLLGCTGYYDYEGGYTPAFPGVERFAGRVVHPQKWTDDVEYAGKRVVVIGSGATAVTLVPELAKKAAHVTMLQRSPSYVVSLPGEDKVAHWLRTKVSKKTAYGLVRWKNVGIGMATYSFCRRFPERAKKLMVGGVRKTLGVEFDVEKHFTPTYAPWDQRVCLVPDGDLFASIRSGKASVKTDTIDTFTETGIRLKSGEEVPADVVVTATGLKLLLAGRMNLVVDGANVEPSKTLNYKGAMLSDVPNFAIVLGYTNASWTLKADLVCEYVCRLLEIMRKQGYRRCTPRVSGMRGDEQPLMNFSSGYVIRALSDLPKQGAKHPWRLYQNYLLDLFGLRHGAVADGILEFA